MVRRINGQLIFCYDCPKIKDSFLIYLIRGGKLYISLFIIIIGIFLLPSQAYLSDVAPEKLIELTNKERIQSGLNALTANQLLAQAAYKKAEAIIETQTFQHNIGDKKFSSWIRDADYKYSYVGENLAIDFVTSEGIIAAWLDSSLHKKNLLSPYFTEIGIATIDGEFQGENTTLVVQIFGAPATAYSQSSILGIDNNNYLLAKNGALSRSSQLIKSGLQVLAINQFNENLITHSALNYSLPSLDFIGLNQGNNKLILNYNPQNKKLLLYQDQSQSSNMLSINTLNKFFEQSYYLFPVFYFLTIVISILFIFLVIYFYFFYFSRISQLIYHSHTKNRKI